MTPPFPTSLISSARMTGCTLLVMVSRTARSHSSLHSLSAMASFRSDSDLRNPKFAYLSACHTTVGDAESPDEAIHLASTMQFAGFRSVIGTMWAVAIAETNKVTSVFYKHIVDESGRLDHTCAAFALRKTMRSVEISLD